MTKYQILLTLYHFLDEEFRENSDRSEAFREYLGNVNPYLWTDGKTADPSYYADFMEIADTLFEGEDLLDVSHLRQSQFLGHLRAYLGRIAVDCLAASDYDIEAAGLAEG